MTQKCSLCGQEKELQESHLIPKFVGKWIKNTSATGYLAKADEASKRVQDLITLRILCHDCEERFSKFETYFANEIFFPFHEKKIRAFEYDARLELFAISLSWRALKLNYDEFKLEDPHLSSLVEQAEIHWREFLMGQRRTISPYENHLLFLDYVKSGKEIPPRFNWYTLRGVDATLAASKEMVFMYIKLPWMVFVTSIYPTTMEGWQGTAIKQCGKISTPQSIKDGVFGQFMKERSVLGHTSSSGPSSEVSEKRLLRAIEKDPKKFLESDTLQTMIAEGDLEREKKMKDMPKTIIALVEEVIILADNPSMGKAENQAHRWSFRKIADALAKLSIDDGTELDEKILHTINQSKTLQQDFQSTFETDTLCVTFMVNRGATKEFQHSRIKQEIEKLKPKYTDENIPVVVFSMNPSDDGVSWESGFLIN